MDMPDIDDIQNRRLDRLEDFQRDMLKTQSDLQRAHDQLRMEHELVSQELRSGLSALRQEVTDLRNSVGEGIDHLESRIDTFEEKVAAKVDQAIRYSPPWVVSVGAVVSALGSGMFTLLITAHVAKPTRIGLMLGLALAVGGGVGWLLRRVRRG